MKRVCVVPLFGDYDNLKDPTIISKGWEYICISDKEQSSKIWKTVLIDGGDLPNKLKSGYVLTQLHRILKYDVCCIVGGQIPLGAGLAFADKYFERDGVTLTYFGDGAARQGILHETFNMAMTWKLPVVFVVENNFYAKREYQYGDLDEAIRCIAEYDLFWNEEE